MCSQYPRTPAEIGEALGKNRTTTTKQIKNLQKENDTNKYALIRQDKKTKKYYTNKEGLIKQWQLNLPELKTQADKDLFEEVVKASFDIFIDRYSIMEKTFFKGVDPTIESLGYFMLNQIALLQDGPREYALRVAATPTAETIKQIAEEHEKKHPSLVRNTKRAIKKGKFKKSKDTKKLKKISSKLLDEALK